MGTAESAILRLNFNPRSLAGATSSPIVFAKLLRISIHAPSRERLLRRLFADNTVYISIHAPSRERLPVNVLQELHKDFNPRSLAGATATPPTGSRRIAEFQSTLPRGSDINNQFLSEPRIDFNPRSLAGATPRTAKTLLHWLFQSTLPRGSDTQGTLSINNQFYFNPRSLAGATTVCERVCCKCCNFNPRSLAGAT